MKNREAFFLPSCTTVSLVFWIGKTCSHHRKGGWGMQIDLFLLGCLCIIPNFSSLMPSLCVMLFFSMVGGSVSLLCFLLFVWSCYLPLSSLLYAFVLLLIVFLCLCYAFLCLILLFCAFRVWSRLLVFVLLCFSVSCLSGSCYAMPFKFGVLYAEGHHKRRHYLFKIYFLIKKKNTSI